MMDYYRIILMGGECMVAMKLVTWNKSKCRLL